MAVLPVNGLGTFNMTQDNLHMGEVFDTTVIKNTPSVAVVILNWNGQKYLEQFLPSVLASTYLNKRIIVADNASTDDSVSFLQEHFPQLKSCLMKRMKALPKVTIPL
jgi:hypothetical protein